uniref:g6f-like n=1 Tax=Semicossyphus pulcher TaxID=241346 RepID=UPI0037E86568
MSVRDSVFSSQFGVPDWHDVVVVREGMSATLACTDELEGGTMVINWTVKPVGSKVWKLVLSANERKEFSGGASKPSMRLADPNYKDSGDFSLFLLPEMEDSGFYSCLVKQNDIQPQGVLKRLVERIILLAILTVTIEPAAPIPQHSTLRLDARVNPDFAVTKITWAAPDTISMKSERINKGTVAKLPMVQSTDSGAYVCMAHPQGKCSRPVFPFNVDVTVADKVVSFNNVTHASLISTATQAGTPFPLTCPPSQGDYILLYWQPPDTTRQSHMKKVCQYDRWRGSTLLTGKGNRLQFAGPPYNAEAGSFSFVLTPVVTDGGLYICEVYLDDRISSQRTKLSVLQVTAKRSPTKLELRCRYTEQSHVQSVKWKYQNESRKLQFSSKSPGTVSIFLPSAVTPDTAGNYTCTLLLRNGQTLSATYAVTLPYKEIVRVTTPSLPPSLSALLLLVPLAAAAAVGVLLWRQKHISDRGIEQSLSVNSGEVDNIYENPEDIRQAPPQGSVYMDLKPRGEDDVYKELER